MFKQKAGSLLPKEVLREIKTILQKNLIRTRKCQVYLFGSYSRGQTHSDSDIDIAIHAQSALDLKLWSQIEEDFQNSEILQKIDVIDFNRVAPDFQKIILDQGKRIYESD